MSAKEEKEQLFHEYFAEWIEVYKRGAVRPITFQKYEMTLRRLTELAPSLKVCELDRRSHQNLINAYAKTHEKQTVIDFHHHLKSAILDAVDEGLLVVDPTRKITIKGKAPTAKKPKFLSQFELKALLGTLNLADNPNWDWFTLLIAKTGLRFSEALAVTPADFDFVQHRLRISKTWNYKNALGGFDKTKNQSSNRTMPIDSQLSAQFSGLTKGLAKDEPIFAKKRVFNSTVNNRLKVLCEKASAPVISIHGLRHTHASLLIFAGVSVASIAKRLGHSSVTTTQKTYLHVIRELEERDDEKVVQYLAELG